MKVLKLIGKFLALFLIGGAVYFGIECLWRGWSHWTMFILGGLCFVIIGGLNEFYGWEMPFWKQCLIGAAVITALEFAIGMIVGIFGTSKLMSYLFCKHNEEIYTLIIGFSLSSLFLLLKETFRYNYSVIEIIIGLILLVIGFFWKSFTHNNF